MENADRYRDRINILRAISVASLRDDTPLPSQGEDASALLAQISFLIEQFFGAAGDRRALSRWLVATRRDMLGFVRLVPTPAK